jgi:prepilin-type N-terminal cleavage/methylation domain-containing protein
MNDRRRRQQAGYTLVELLVATAVGALIMVALTSIVLTTAISTNVATSRVDASSEIRNFQLSAYDDLAFSTLPTAPGCGTQGAPCTTQPMVLQGQRVPNLVNGAPAPYTVTYTWDPVARTVTRQAGPASRPVAEDVTRYSWYTDQTAAHPTVVITLTVTVATYNASYNDTQTFRFVPMLS